MLRVRNYLLESTLVNNPVRIVNITDVHSNVKHLISALEYASSIDANIITIPGDLFDSVDNTHNREIVDVLKRIKDIDIYISNGNHDLVTFKGKGILAKTQENRDLKYYDSLKENKNIHVFLANDEIFYNDLGIEIAGFDPGYDWYDKNKESSEVFNILLNKYMSEFPKTNRFRIMLIHSCNGLIVNNELSHEIDGFNLVLSGHNHSGITPEFIQDISKKNRGIAAPYNNWFMPGSYGFWTKGSTSVILSNGLTKMGETHGSKFTIDLVNKILKCDIEVINLSRGENHNLKLVSKSVQKK